MTYPDNGGTTFASYDLPSTAAGPFQADVSAVEVVIKIPATALAITLSPADQVVNAGDPATFTASASGDPVPTVQWQVSTNHGTTFNNITGATTASFTLTTDPSLDGYEYQAVFTNSSGSAVTTAAILTVKYAPMITTQPTSLAVDSGQPVILNAAARANPPAAVQWLLSTDGGHTFTNISGATSTALSVTTAATPALDGNEYRAIFTNALGSTTTDAAVLSVTLPGFSYNASTKVLTITGSAAVNSFTFAQASSVDAAGTLHTTYYFTLNGVSASYPDSALSQVIVIGAAGSANTAIVITSDIYTGADGKQHETAESIQSGPGGGTVFKSDSIGNVSVFLQLSGFQSSYTYAGRADSALLQGTVGVGIENVFVTAGTYAYEFQAGGSEFHLISGAAAVYGYAVNLTDQDWQYDTAGSLDAFVASGNAYNYMSGSDTSGSTFFNIAVGFHVAYGISTHGNAIAYLIDSPGNDVFVGDATVSYLSGSDNAGSVFNVAEGFIQINAESFVGGLDTTDYAYNHDPSHNIIAGRWTLLT
jgi:hypothetical protein